MAKRPRKEMSGFLDFFLPKRREGPRRSIFAAFGRPAEPEEPRLHALPAPAQPGPLIPRPEQAPVPVRPSIFEFAAPEAPVGEPPERPSIFAALPPSPPPAPTAPAPAAPPEEQTSFWAGMFTPEPERPMAAFFGQATPEERPPRWVPVSVYRQTVAWQHIWPFPTIEQLLQTLRQNLDLGKIFRELQATRETLDFWRQMEESAQHGQPVILKIAPVVQRELWSDLSRFFGVPTEVFAHYMMNARTPEEEREAFSQVWHEVISPLIFAMQEAFESITPANIPGWFTVVVDERTGEYWLYYVEALMPPPPPAGLPYGGQVG